MTLPISRSLVQPQLTTLPFFKISRLVIIRQLSIPGNIGVMNVASGEETSVYPRQPSGGMPLLSLPFGMVLMWYHNSEVTCDYFFNILLLSTSILLSKQESYHRIDEMQHTVSSLPIFAFAMSSLVTFLFFSDSSNLRTSSSIFLFLWIWQKCFCTLALFAYIHEQ